MKFYFYELKLRNMDSYEEKSKINICIVCGNEFEVSNKHMIYCSKKCRDEGKKRKVNSSPRRKVKECLFCGKRFTTGAYTPNQKFCSLECHYKSMKKNSEKTEDKSKKAKKKASRVTCPKCNSIFYTTRNSKLCPLCRELE